MPVSSKSKEMVKTPNKTASIVSTTTPRHSLQLSQLVRIKHNLLLSNFYKRGCKDAGTFYEDFFQLIHLGKVEAEVIYSKTLKYPMILYNLAVQNFQHKMYEQSQSLVTRLMVYYKGEDLLSKLLQLLNIAILMNQQRLDLVLLHIDKLELGLSKLPRTAAIESTNATQNSTATKSKKKKTRKKLYKLPSNDFEVRMRLRLQQKKTECLLRTRALPDAKREYKKSLNLANSVPKHETSLNKLIALQKHLKAFLQYLTKRPDKALNVMKILAYGENKKPLGLCTMTNPLNVESFFETGDNLSIILNNNAACCYQMMRKPLIASWFLKQASDECDNLNYKIKKELPMHCLSYNLKYQVMYNYGVTNLYSKQPYKGFYYLWLTSRRAFPNNAKLWLHLAQCCIQIFQRKKSKDPCPEDSLVEPFEEFMPTCPITGKQMPFPSGDLPPRPTLKFGLGCIRKALKLIHPVIITKNGGVFVPPCEPITNEQAIVNLRATLLITGCYIALIVKEFKFVIKKCRKLTKLPNIPLVYQCLCKNYLAIALSLTKELKMSLRVYAKESTNNYGFVLPAVSSESDAKRRSISTGTNGTGSSLPETYKNYFSRFSDWHPIEEIDARDAFIYNRALTLVKARQFKTADKILKEWLKTTKQCRPCSLKFVQLEIQVHKIVEIIKEKEQIKLLKMGKK